MFARRGSVTFHISPDRVLLIRRNAVFLIRPEFLLGDFLCFVLLVCRVMDYQNVVMEQILISF